MSDGPWQGAKALSAEEAAFQSLLEGDERIVWTWRERRKRPAWLDSAGTRAVGRLGPEGMMIAYGGVGLAVSLTMLRNDIGRRSEVLIICAMLAAAMIFYGIFLLVAPEAWRRAARKEVAGMLRSDGVISGEGALHALTQHRLLSTFDGAYSAVTLHPGEPIIQYGNLRIDRPNRRGMTMIGHIPMPEQHRLFAALKQARAIREGREA